MNRTIQVPISKEDAKSLRAGDYVLLNGTIYTARDAAHKRMYEALAEGKELPLERGSTDRLARSDNRKPYGQVYPTASRSRSRCNDRKGKAQSGGH